MNKKTVSYAEAPRGVGKAILTGKRVADFLPLPRDLEQGNSREIGSYAADSKVPIWHS